MPKNEEKIQIVKLFFTIFANSKTGQMPKIALYITFTSIFPTNVLLQKRKLKIVPTTTTTSTVPWSGLCRRQKQVFSAIFGNLIYRYIFEQISFIQWGVAYEIFKTLMDG